jgi:hypothetical protein
MARGEVAAHESLKTWVIGLGSEAERIVKI